MTYRHPMNTRDPSPNVRRLAGRVLMMLVHGPQTVADMEAQLLQEKTSIQRAIKHIETWDIGLSKERRKSATRGSRPVVFSLDGGPEAMAAIRAVVGVDRKAPVSAIVAVGMAVEAGW